MRTFEIWMEGYRATGEHGVAQRVGFGKGNTFDEAVEDYMSKKPSHGIDQRDSNGEKYWTIWACQLYDNEGDARKAFG